MSDKTKKWSQLRYRMFKVQRLKAGAGFTSIVPDIQRNTRAMECLRGLKEKDGRDRERRRQVAPEGIVLK